MKTLYKIITIIFQPLLVPTYGMILLMNMQIFSPLPSFWRLVAVGGTFVFTGLLPALPVLLLMRRGEVHDVFISNREERTMPYLFSFMAYVFWALFMWRTMQFPLFIVSMGIGSAISIFIIIFINLKWKISAHVAGMGGLSGAVFGVSYRLAINPVWLFIIVLTISAIVALSRIELKAHTPAQTLAGFAIGFAAVFIPCFFF
ncbi:MAG: phosphatase PAP2 family protein [Paludibacter sp.]|nr:phosphatase PAP2 family protein [Paludibacter sp.]